MQQVFDTFKNVYLWYDNDFQHAENNSGQIDAKNLIEKFPSLRNVCIPTQYKSKDPSDLVKNWGRSMLIQVWNELK